MNVRPEQMIATTMRCVKIPKEVTLVPVMLDILGMVKIALISTNVPPRRTIVAVILPVQISTDPSVAPVVLDIPGMAQPAVAISDIVKKV